MFTKGNVVSALIIGGYMAALEACRILGPRFPEVSAIALAGIGAFGLALHLPTRPGSPPPSPSDPRLEV